MPPYPLRATPRPCGVENLGHVVNYDLPSAPEAYVHRVGRAGRAGVAVTLVEPREHRTLKTIERATRRTIDVQTLPTVADLRAHRMELTRAALRETPVEDGYEPFRGVVEPLTEEFDVMDVALAAVKLAHEAGEMDGGDEEEIPQASFRPQRAPGGRDRRDRPASRGGRVPARGTTRLFVGAGRTSGIRPQDLFGAVVGETALESRDIGGIEIADRFSLVEVPESAADDVIRAAGHHHQGQETHRPQGTHAPAVGARPTLCAPVGSRSVPLSRRPPAYKPAGEPGATAHRLLRERPEAFFMPSDTSAPQVPPVPGYRALLRGREFAGLYASFAPARRAWAPR
ncbi:DbpA RNA binding domain-containing protein [Streptomyces bungoensis]|uniref:DbpA RNA binding domain-containing protein n=1 Tax=Streptomyces bungoensis TaxID=285568 RepID=UPI0036AFC980